MSSSQSIRILYASNFYRFGIVCKYQTRWHQMRTDRDCFTIVQSCAICAPSTIASFSSNLFLFASMALCLATRSALQWFVVQFDRKQLWRTICLCYSFVVMQRNEDEQQWNLYLGEKTEYFLKTNDLSSLCVFCVYLRKVFLPLSVRYMYVIIDHFD